MITTKKVGSKKEFEALLDDTRDSLNTNLSVGASLKNKEFEDSVLEAMCLMAKNTPFDKQIKQTGKLAFPDIVISEYYGVEVKQTERKKFISMGNSIFENTRDKNVEDIYFMMVKTGDVIEIRWASYADSLDDIIITHSPRYSVNLEDNKIKVFDKMGISYDNFRKLPVKEKMKFVKKLYSGSSHWWNT